jgi:HAD superfamily hydrolase (TIGR01544 family)
MEKFDEKVKAFPEKFAVISDFDFTLTRFNENGHSISTIHLMRVSDKKSLLPKETLEQTEKLFSQYHPFELNFEIDPLERSKLMLEWWTKEYTLFTNAGIKEQDMYNIVEKSEPFLRFGVLEFFKICKRYQIPLHVLSAGIGNFIKIIFEKIGVNVDIRANTLTLNENHEISGFQVPVIHSGNKSSSVSDLDYEAVVVLGDMPSVILI